MFSLRQQPAKSDQRGSVTVWTAAVTVCSVSCISWVRHQHTRVLRRPARCWYRIHHSVSLSSRSSFFPSIQSLFLSACGARRVNMKVFSRRFSGEPDSALEKVDIKCLYRDDCILNLQWKKKKLRGSKTNGLKIFCESPQLRTHAHMKQQFGPESCAICLSFFCWKLTISQLV